MGSKKDEIRRLMKEAKQKPSAPTASRQEPSSVRAKPPVSKVGSSTASPAIPAGFFDDSLADAKARKVDVKQLAEKQLESEWEAFQEFATEVENQSAKEEKEHVEETKEREAVEQLENMQYVDRYRAALERATNLRNGDKKPKTEKRKSESTDEVVEEDGETEGASAVQSALNECKQKRKKRKKSKKQQELDSGDSDDDFDPCNWRSRGIF